MVGGKPLPRVQVEEASVGAQSALAGHNRQQLECVGQNRQRLERAGKNRQRLARATSALAGQNRQRLVRATLALPTSQLRVHFTEEELGQPAEITEGTLTMRSISETQSGRLDGGCGRSPALAGDVEKLSAGTGLTVVVGGGRGGGEAVLRRARSCPRGPLQ